VLVAEDKEKDTLLVEIEVFVTDETGNIIRIHREKKRVEGSVYYAGMNSVLNEVKETISGKLDIRLCYCFPPKEIIGN
jgi:hypothetical protein